MMILALVRNYIPSYGWVVRGGWNIADCVERSYDLEGMKVGTVAAGRIGLAVLRRLKPFDVELHYTDRHRLSPEIEQELDLTFHETTAAMVPNLDVVTINAPLYPETEGLFDDELISTMKRGAYLVNTARGKICDRDAVVRALESGQLAGYAGDVWFPQPPPKDHPWRTMPHHGMTPHISGTSLSAQARYAAGTREILECFFEGRPIRQEYLIVDGGQLAGAGAHSYSAGNVTVGIGGRSSLQELNDRRVGFGAWPRRTSPNRNGATISDLFVQLGPDAPTLCSGWVTADLAAHLVARERRPDSGPGLVWPPLAAHTDKVRRSIRDRTPWERADRLRAPGTATAPSPLRRSDEHRRVLRPRRGRASGAVGLVRATRLRGDGRCPLGTGGSGGNGEEGPGDHRAGLRRSRTEDQGVRATHRDPR